MAEISVNQRESALKWRESDWKSDLLKSVDDNLELLPLVGCGGDDHLPDPDLWLLFTVITTLYCNNFEFFDGHRLLD